MVVTLIGAIECPCLSQSVWESGANCGLSCSMQHAMLAVLGLPQWRGTKCVELAGDRGVHTAVLLTGGNWAAICSGMMMTFCCCGDGVEASRMPWISYRPRVSLFLFMLCGSVRSG